MDEIIDFKNNVMERFANPTIQHQWVSIMLNSMSKYKERILPVVKFNAKCPKYSLFGLASLISLYKLNVKENLFTDNQEFLDFYKELFTNNYSNDYVVGKVLNLDFWEYEFSSEMTDFVKFAYSKIVSDGIEKAVTWLESL